MSRPSRYRADLSGRAHIPKGIWLLLAATLGWALVLGAYLSYRHPQVQLLQARILSQRLLADAPQRSRAPSPELRRKYAEVINVSKELSLPVHDWLACLQAPEDAQVVITGLDWNTSGAWVELRLTANSREEAGRYLEARRKSGSACRIALSQEERAPEGGALLHVRVRPQAGAPSP